MNATAPPADTQSPSTTQRSAVTVVPPGQGRSYWVVGDLVTFKIGSEQSGGAYAFAEVTVPPGGGPPPHVHRREDELFYVLDGSFAFVVGDHLVQGSRGFTAHLFKGIPHTFRNVGDRAGRLLVAAMPCGFDAFIPTVGTPCTDPSAPCPPVTQADVDRLLAASPRFGVETRFDHQPTSPAPGVPLDRQLCVLGEHVRIKLGGPETGGQFSVAEVTSRPGGGVPPHTHRREDEIFYVLEGAYEFQLGDRTITAVPGTLVHVPRGTVHSFRNVGETDAKLLDYHTPGGFEAFFEEIGVPCTDVNRPVPKAPPDVEKLVPLFRKHGLELALPMRP